MGRKFGESYMPNMGRKENGEKGDMGRKGYMGRKEYMGIKRK